jgi:hypothetical protein
MNKAFHLRKEQITFDVSSLKDFEQSQIFFLFFFSRYINNNNNRINS